MSILGIDIGTSTTKVVEYLDEKIVNKTIIRDGFSKQKLDDFIKTNNINVEKIVFTGIGASKINTEEFDILVNVVDEFSAIANGGLFLTKKEKALVVSVGTGTAATKLFGTGLSSRRDYNVTTKSRCLPVRFRKNVRKWWRNKG